MIFQTKNFNLWYGDKHALKDIHIDIPRNQVTAIIGPSGCGKSTYLKTLNRMSELNPQVRTTGEILFEGRNIFDKELSAQELRKRVGMVFQKPNPFPKSIRENVLFGPKIHGERDRYKLEEILETSLRAAALWDEVKDRLGENAYSLSGGQQQRLCIARCLAVNPQVILMDEPTSALDPIATSKIEDLVEELKRDYSIVIVTHSMQQAARISDKTAFFLMGELIEWGETETMFTSPRDKRTEDYLTGRFG